MKYRIVVIGVLIGSLSISCASNKNQRTPNVDTEGLEQSRQIDAGSAEVRLQLVTLNDNIAQVEVKEIMGYGMSAGRLAPSQTIEVSVHETLIERLSEMESGTEFEAVLAMQPAGINTPTGWTITKILDR